MKRTFLFFMTTVFMCMMSCSKANNDLQKICQLTLDLPALQQYYHVEDAPGRKPLVILKNEFIEGYFNLSKFGKPVIVLSREEIHQKKIAAYFEFTSIEQSENSAITKFSYPVEGIRGKVTFKKIGKNWKITEHALIEE